jgi:hypothetical protein
LIYFKLEANSDSRNVTILIAFPATGTLFTILQGEREAT